MSFNKRVPQPAHQENTNIEFGLLVEDRNLATAIEETMRSQPASPTSSQVHNRTDSRKGATP
jgi:hypothetical protein